MIYNMKRILSSLLIILMMCSLTLAHSGRTDSKGGHYNRSTGEYHYHHGYSAHQHPNGICPYSYNSKTNSSSSNSSANQSNSNKEEKKTTIGEVLGYIFIFIFFGIPYVVGIIGAVCSILIIPLTNLWDWIKKKFNKK